MSGVLQLFKNAVTKYGLIIFKIDRDVKQHRQWRNVGGNQRRIRVTLSVPHNAPLPLLAFFLHTYEHSITRLHPTQPREVNHISSTATAIQRNKFPSTLTANIILTTFKWKAKLHNSVTSAFLIKDFHNSLVSIFAEIGPVKATRYLRT